MDALKDFYDFYRPLQRKYDLQMIYKTNSKETKITIRWRGKEIVKVAEETTEACFIRARRELEERMKKYEQQTETKEKAADAKRIFGVMGLGVKCGEEITVCTDGENEEAAGTLLLDTYKQKKQECDRRISEVQEQIEQSKVEESTKSVTTKW